MGAVTLSCWPLFCATFSPPMHAPPQLLHTLLCACAVSDTCLWRVMCPLLQGMSPLGSIWFAALTVCTHHPCPGVMPACPPNFMPPWAWVCRHGPHWHTPAQSFSIDLHLPHVCRMRIAKQTLHKHPQCGGLHSTACWPRGANVRAAPDGGSACGNSRQHVLLH